MKLVSDRARGLGFALLSVMAVSPDGILLILMSDHVQPLAVLFWKSLVIGAGCLLVAAAPCRDYASAVQGARASGGCDAAGCPPARTVHLPARARCDR